MKKGAVIKDEESVRETNEIGITVWRITSHKSVNHQLYFLTTSFTGDGRHVVFASDRYGKMQYFLREYPSGDIVQLTDGPEVHAYSGTMNRAGNTLIFARGGEIWRLDLDTLRETLIQRFEGGQLGECALNCDETLIVAAMRRGKGYYLTVTNADGSGGRIIQEWPQTVFHPQFHPRIPDLIEFASDPAPRMHMIRADGSDLRLLRDHGNDVFFVHETFLGDDGDLIVVHWPYALKRFSPETGEMSDIARFNAWHISPSHDGRFVACDTVHPDIGIQIVEAATGRRKFLCRPDSSNSGDQWRHDYYFVPEEAPAVAGASGESAESLSWLEMKTDTTYGPQWTHPHPSWSRGDDKVAFTSDKTGTPQVYVAEIPDGFLDFGRVDG